MTLTQLFSKHFLEILENHFSWQAQYLVMLEGNLCVAPRIVNNVSYVTRVNHESHFSWQAQSFVMYRRVTFVAPRLVNNVSYVTINHESQFRGRRSLVLLDRYNLICCSVHCK